MLRKWILLLVCVALIGMVAIAEETDPDYDGPENAKAILVPTLYEDEQLDNGYKGKDISVTTDSFMPDSLEEDSMDRMVIGSDDRVTVKNTSAYPFSAIAYMKVHARCGCDWECSGFMKKDGNFDTMHRPPEQSCNCAPSVHFEGRLVLVSFLPCFVLFSVA